MSLSQNKATNQCLRRKSQESGGTGPLQGLWHSLACPSWSHFLVSKLERGGLLWSFFLTPHPYVFRQHILLVAWLFSTTSADLISQGFKNTPGVTSHTAPKVAGSTLISSACPGHLLSWWNCPQGSLPMQFSCLFSFSLGSVALGMDSPLRKGQLVSCFFKKNSLTFLNLVQLAFIAGSCRPALAGTELFS